MPIYEYRCDKCHEQFEIRQHIMDNTLILCPKCNANTLYKIFSGVRSMRTGSAARMDGYNKDGKKVTDGLYKKEDWLDDRTTKG